MSDNWKARSKGMVCSKCVYYVPKENEDEEITIVGRCRRNAPTMNGYPVVFESDWCGGHKLNENSVDVSYEED